MDQNLSHNVVKIQKIFRASDILRVKSELNILFPLLMAKLQKYTILTGKIEGASPLHWVPLTCPRFRYLSYLSFYYRYQGIQIITGSMVLLLKKVVLENLGSALLNIKIALQWHSRQHSNTKNYMETNSN